MCKKTTLLALTIGSLVALALPGTAAAAWKHHQTAIKQDVSLGATGNVRFQSAFGGVECQVTSKARFQAGQTTGIVETFVPHPSNETTNCKGLGALAFCQTHDITPATGHLGLPWTIHTAPESHIISTVGDLTGTLTGGFCPMMHVSLTANSVTLTPNQAETVSSVQLGGSAQVHLQTNLEVATDSQLATISGTLTIEAPNAGTYSI